MFATDRPGLERTARSRGPRRPPGRSVPGRPARHAGGVRRPGRLPLLGAGRLSHRSRDPARRRPAPRRLAGEFAVGFAAWKRPLHDGRQGHRRARRGPGREPRRVAEAQIRIPEEVGGPAAARTPRALCDRLRDVFQQRAEDRRPATEDGRRRRRGCLRGVAGGKRRPRLRDRCEARRGSFLPSTTRRRWS